MRKSDEPITLTKNAIAALMREQFTVTRHLVGLQKLPPEVNGYKVNLSTVVSWAIKERHIHGVLSNEVVFDMKIDGCPFFGKLP